MTTYGLTPEGFQPKTLAISKAELEAAFLALFSANMDLGPGTPQGNIIGAVAERFAELWDETQAVYSSQDPDQATGSALDIIAALTGTIRQAATKSTDTVFVTGTAGTVIPSGRVVSVPGTGVRFATTATGTITAVPAWAASTPYVLGDRASRLGNIYEVTTGGTSGAIGPSGSGTGIADGTVAWRFIATGTAGANIPVQAEETGPKIARAGTLTTIETPVSGWNAATNLLDATPGRDIETDSALRLRRESELRAGGKSALDAMRADLLAVPDVQTVTMFENATATTDADGMPPHSVEALVQGGVDQDIWDALLATKPAGIQTHGTEVGTATDASGVDRTLKFSRPAEIDIFATVTVVYDAALYPSDGDNQVRQALVDYGDTFNTGRNVVASALAAQAFNVSGVMDASVVIGLSSGTQTAATIPMSTRQLAVFDTSRTTVVSAPGAT